MNVKASAVRHLHERSVLDAVRTRRSATRAEIMRETGLSRATVFRITTDLLQRKVLVESDSAPVRVSRGRPTTLLALAPRPDLALAAHLEHHRVRVVVGDATGAIHRELGRPVELAAGFDHTVAAAAELIAELSGGLSTGPGSGAGVALPFPVGRDGRTARARFRKEDVSAALGLRSRFDRVVVGNDAHVSAAGEAAFGAGHRFRNFVYVELSHGVGAGIVLGRSLYRGLGNAGNLGHVPVRRDGQLCHCGNRGCLETIASGRALVRALEPVSQNDSLTLADIVALADRGDAGVQRLALDMGHDIGDVLADVVSVLNPDGIVVGGPLAGLGGPLVRGLEESIRQKSSRRTAGQVTVTRARCGDRAALLGGLALSLGLVDEIAT